VFNFYPLTAVMIVMLALLNDGAILSIAYDNVHYKDKPEAWNMRLVLGISTVLGLIGVVSAFGLFYLGERVFHLDRAHIQTLMYLKLSVAGHLTIFLTRTRGRSGLYARADFMGGRARHANRGDVDSGLWALYDAPRLAVGTVRLGYALAWFLLNDRVKLLAYRIFDPTKAPLLAKKSLDLTPRIATRAYELYQQRVRGESQADQDWLEAEREIRNDQAGKTKVARQPPPEPHEC